MKNHLIAMLMSCFLLTPALAQHRDVPRNVTTASVPAAGAAEHRWGQLLAYVNGLPPSHRVGHINLVVNQFRYASDMETTGEEDHWDTPLEFVARGAGDCEDFAIAKYFMLLESGIAPELVRLAFVFYTGDAKALGSTAAHPKRTHVVVLRYEHIGDRDPLVLDALPQIAPLSERDDLHLVFEFGADGTYASAVSEQTVSTRAINRMMDKWFGVLDRMRGSAGREATMYALGNRAQAVQVAQAPAAARAR